MKHRTNEVKLQVLVLIAMEESKVRVGIESYYSVSTRFRGRSKCQNILMKDSLITFPNLLIPRGV